MTNVLIVCPDNTARSVLCEGMLNHWAVRFRRKVRAFSAGWAPSGVVDPHALDVLTASGVDVAGARAKSYEEFVREVAPRMRVVITVTDASVPVPSLSWPGGPLQVRWDCPDPSKAAEFERRAAFESTRKIVGAWMLQLLALPLDSMADRDLNAALLKIPVSPR